MISHIRHAPVWVLVGLLPVILAGCEGSLLFTTGTKFGIHAYQRGDQLPEVLVGYKRIEVASIPVPKEGQAATEEQDVYSVLGSFCVKYDPTLRPSGPDAVQIRSVMATGMAARKAAEDESMRRFFAESASKTAKGERHLGKTCF